MDATNNDMVSGSQVEAAAGLVGLPLSPADRTAVAELLSQWIPAALELSARMSTRENDDLIPITTFTIPHSPSSAPFQ